MSAEPKFKELLSTLIGFNTVSAYSNRVMIDFVKDYLASFGITCNIEPNEDGTKADLIAPIGPMVEGGIVLSGRRPRLAFRPF
jgi:acetylornithine deacetylase